MIEVVAATSNKHKLKEFRELFKDLDIKILSLDDVGGAPEVIEDGDSFEANSGKKALEVSNYLNMPTFADDSGIVVEALDGKPGIYSARYAGENATDAENLDKLISDMKGCTNRNARFVCVISIAINGIVVASFKGEVKGTLTNGKSGGNGFGYDPIFIPDGYDKTFGDLGEDIKAKISHRAKAAQQVVDFVEEEMSALDDLDLL